MLLDDCVIHYNILFWQKNEVTLSKDRIFFHEVMLYTTAFTQSSPNYRVLIWMKNFFFAASATFLLPMNIVQPIEKHGHKFFHKSLWISLPSFVCHLDSSHL